MGSPLTTYRKLAPYRKPQSYRGAELVPAVGEPGTVAFCATPWGARAPRDGAMRTAWNQAEPHDRDTAIGWGAPAANDGHVATSFDQLAPHDRAMRLPWDRLAPRDRTASVRFRQFEAHDRVGSLRWDAIAPHARTDAAHWRQLAPHDRSASLPWGRIAAHALQASLLWRRLAERGAFVALPWGPMGARQAGVQIDWPVDSNPGEGPITVPILPVYVMLPTITAKRVSDDAPLPILGADLRCDIDSWAWSFTAPMAYAGKSLIDPAGYSDPVEIEINVNGYAWRMLVEGYDDNHRFGAKTLTIRGRSPSALLAAPYAPRRTFTQEGDARLAAQLAGDELDGTGWTLAWDAVDWLLPGGTFTYADLAPIDAISRLADAIGATVFSEPVDRTLRVAPTYADSPWAWAAATPYAILPAAILTSGDGQWAGGSNANGIFIRSEDDTVAALVRITGTDGANQLPMVVERLLVHADAVRERGRNDLAAAGMIKTETRILPLFPEAADPGLILPGKLVEFVEAEETWRGLVRSVRITASRQGGANSVRQVLDVERQVR